MGHTGNSRFSHVASSLAQKKKIVEDALCLKRNITNLIPIYTVYTVYTDFNISSLFAVYLLKRQGSQEGHWRDKIPRYLKPVSCCGHRMLFLFYFFVKILMQPQGIQEKQSTVNKSC